MRKAEKNKEQHSLYLKPVNFFFWILHQTTNNIVSFLLLLRGVKFRSAMHPYVTQPAVGSLTFWATAISLGVIVTFTIPLLLGIVYVATQRKNNPSKEKQGLLESVTSTSSTSSVATTSSFPTSQTTLVSSLALLFKCEAYRLDAGGVQPMRGLQAVRLSTS